MNTYFVTIEDEQYILLTTFRKTGEPVPTPVWFSLIDDRIYVQTGASTGKVKRLKNNPSVTVVACDARGNVKEGAETLQAIGTFVTDASELSQAEEHLSQKYGFMRSLLTAMTQIQAWLTRKKRQDTIIVITAPVPKSANM